jgi:hypothetical protein
MRNPYRYFNSSPEVIRLPVMLYIRSPLSLRLVADLLFEPGIDICHETVRALVVPIRPERLTCLRSVVDLHVTSGRPSRYPPPRRGKARASMPIARSSAARCIAGGRREAVRLQGVSAFARGRWSGVECSIGGAREGRRRRGRGR